MKFMQRGLVSFSLAVSLVFLLSAVAAADVSDEDPIDLDMIVFGGHDKQPYITLTVDLMQSTGPDGSHPVTMEGEAETIFYIVNSASNSLVPGTGSADPFDAFFLREPFSIQAGQAPGNPPVVFDPVEPPVLLSWGADFSDGAHDFQFVCYDPNYAEIPTDVIYIPEPGTVVMLLGVVGGLLLLVIRRRRRA